MEVGFAVGLAVLGALGAWLVQEWRLGSYQRRFALMTRVNAQQSQEVHDALLQGFLGVAWQVEAASTQLPAHPEQAKDQIDRLLVKLDSVLSEARQSIWDLEHREAGAVDFARQAEELAASVFASAEGMHQLHCEGSPTPLQGAVAHSLLYILREALWNAKQHARASHIRTVLHYGEHLFRIRVEDDGNGLIPTVDLAEPGKWGIASMRQRALKLKANLEVEGRPGAGSSITISIEGGQTYSDDAKRFSRFLP